MTAQDVIKALSLTPIPEGGFYCEKSESAHSAMLSHGERKIYSSCYYLLDENDVSCFHRLKSDEMWFYHLGASFTMCIVENGTLKTVVLGNDITNGEQPQILLPAGTVFGAKPNDGWALCSCVVSPALDDADIEL
ncbi:MAG: cupin domain-containing protein, partial [Christensenella sp.]